MPLPVSPLASSLGRQTAHGLIKWSSSVERIGIEKGRQEGLREGLLKAVALTLQSRFGQAGLELLPEIECIQNLATLEALTQAAITAQSLDELRPFIPKNPAQ